MAAVVPLQGNVTVPDANTVKANIKAAETFFERFTPEHSPEPPEIVVENENDVKKTQRLLNLIDQIKIDGSAKDTNPFKVLGAKSTEHLRSRLPKLKEVLEEEVAKGTNGAPDALKCTLLKLLLLRAKLIQK
jgi:hypothetical protein